MPMILPVCTAGRTQGQQKQSVQLQCQGQLGCSVTRGWEEEEEEIAGGSGNRVVLILCLEDSTCHQIHSHSISSALGQLWQSSISTSRDV